VILHHLVCYNKTLPFPADSSLMGDINSHPVNASEVALAMAALPFQLLSVAVWHTEQRVRFLA